MVIPPFVVEGAKIRDYRLGFFYRQGFLVTLAWEIQEGLRHMTIERRVT